jgi:2-polyprenyl-6-hydroxyphenyl methylase/3-demethylubiquinone-9 3-methyltransferase
MKEKTASAAANTVDSEEIERFSRIAEEWWDTQGKFKPLHRIAPVRVEYIKQQVNNHFGTPQNETSPFEGLTLLDIGCGGGLVSEPMARLGARVTGVDASQKNISVASLHAQQGGLEIDYRATSPETMQKEAEKFDVVLALEIVEHVADIPAFVQACAALVKPGGLMIWSTINRTPKSYALAIVGAEYILRWLPVGTHQWQKFVRPSELGMQLQAQGLKLTDMQGMVMNPLNFQWRLDKKDLQVNYLLCAEKPAA